jgi:protein-S-isoprenylcysteine O-methyltransferase Ste14
MHVLELKVPPAVLGGLVGFLMWLASRWAPAFALTIPRHVFLSTGLAIFGAAIAISGIISFRQACTTVNPTKPGTASSLVVSGVYKFTRNPMYLGFASVLLGWAVFLSNALTLLLVPLFVVYLNRFQIRPEERALDSLFPNQFAAYKARVRRWL